MKSLRSIAFLLVCCLCNSLNVLGQEGRTEEEWCNEMKNSVNRERSVAVAIPFLNATDAETKSIDESSFYHSLNGIWKFHWVPDPKDRPVGFYQPKYDVSSWDNITVPSNWQVEGLRKCKPWDKPLYSNTVYPFAPKDNPQWPNVIQPRPAEYTYADMPNPVGSYRREFSIPGSWEGRNIYIRFNGVEAGYYLWINGKKVGYSEDSYLPSEFNITSYLRKGNNVLAVEVYRWTDSSFLECQDFWRLSGIFRDVFLWSAPKTQIRDFFFQADLDRQYRDAQVTLDIDIEGNAKSLVWVTLKDREGRVVFQQEKLVNKGKNSLGFEVKNPLKWTVETPNLYTLTLQLKQNGEVADIRSAKVGFRKIELGKDGCFLVNGQPIKFRGVNRHDHSPLTGRTVSKEDMLHDVRLMKKMNINGIRTSHYPNNPFFYELCDQYGLYVIAEANIECHAYGQLSSEPTWKDAFVERNENQVLRYRNHPSIIIWSLGNESAGGPNFKDAELAIKRLDKTRVSHYCENSDYCDVSSSMYPRLGWLEEVGSERLALFRKGETVKPHIICEYAHAMGNSIGNLKEYDEMFNRYPALAGGFIWDWVDQGIQVPTPDGKGIFMACGGDFGDNPTRGNFCTNGIVFADRTYSAKAFEVKKVFQPVYVQKIGEDKYRFINRKFHSDFSDYYVEYTITDEGRVIAKGNVPSLNIQPQQSEELTVPVAYEAEIGHEYFINFSVRQKTATLWAEAGYEVAAEQFLLQRSGKPACIPTSTGLLVNETQEAFIVTGQDFTAMFSKQEGCLTSYLMNGKPMISNGMHADFFRAPIDNDKRASDAWQHWDLYHTSCLPGRWEVKRTPQGIHLNIKNIYSSQNDFSYQVSVIYLVSADGTILVESDFIPSREKQILPHVGFRLEMPEGFERLQWYGRGPLESYSDRKDAQFVDLYSSTVTDQWVNYVAAQEMANHEETRWMSLTDQDGQGLLFVADSLMASKALHARAQDMCRYDSIQGTVHPYQVNMRKETVISLDAVMRGVGNGSCGPDPLERYELRTAPISFRFLMMPIGCRCSVRELADKARVAFPKLKF